MSCLFCKIAAGEIPSKKVYSDDRVFAFEDIAPKAPTHILVVPRRHIARLADAGPEDAALIGEVAHRAATIARDRGLSDYRLVVNNGEGAGQSVFHVHFHLLAGRPFSLASGLSQRPTLSRRDRACGPRRAPLR